MPRVFLIHGWEGHPDGAWRPWLKKQLEQRSFEVAALSMPDTNHPKLGSWVPHLARSVGTPDENTYLVGHSAGCITILRYLETLKPCQQIGGAVLVAGFTDNLGYKELDSFFQTPLDWKTIKSHCKKFVAIHSDNDPYVPLRHSEIFKKNLNAETVVEHDKKHYGEDDGITKLPPALKAVLRLSGKK